MSDYLDKARAWLRRPHKSYEAEGGIDASLAALLADECEKRDEKWREREAACCPEDVPFDEYIRALERERATLRAALVWVKSFAAAHHADNKPHELLHALVVDIPEVVDRALAGAEPPTKEATRDEG